VRTVSTSSLATAADRDVPSRPSRLVSLRRLESEEGRLVKPSFTSGFRMFPRVGGYFVGKAVIERYELYDVFTCPMSVAVRFESVAHDVLYHMHDVNAFHVSVHTNVD
jgi:hypothetical protein